MAFSEGEEFEEFYRAQRPRLCRSLLALSDDTRFVDDVVQDVLLLARRKWPVLRGYDKPEAWAVKVALRRLRRRQAQDRSRCGPLPDGDAWQPRSPGVCEVVAEQQDLYRAIRDLPDRQRESIVLHYLLGYQVTEVADLLGISAGSVKTGLHHGRRKLEAMLLGSREGAMP